jgi:hypothetical protein
MTKIFKNTIKSLLALFLFLFISCKKSKPATPKPVLELSEAEKARLPLLYKDYAVSTEEAIAEALSLMPSTARRSGGVFSVKTYKILPNHARSAQDSVSAFHVVNFADRQGFVIVAGDRRMSEPVLAFVEGSNLTQDSINPGLALFLDMSHAYALQEIESREQLRDSIYLQLKEKLGKIPLAQARPATQDGSSYYNPNRPVRDEFVYGEWREEKRIELKDVNGRWLDFGQDAPFSNYVPKDCGEYKAPAGCVATAIAQIMAYYQYPYGRNWANILNWYSRWYGYRQDFDIASLMRDIGQATNMNYGCAGSGASNENAIRLLRNWGYTATGLMNFNADDVVTQISSYRRPIYLTGCNEKTTNFWGVISYGRCHAWLADGYLLKTRTVKYCYGPSCKYMADEQLKFLHMNWGWEGYKNGYFVPGVFNADTPAKIPMRGGLYDFRYVVEYFIAHP